MMITKNFLKRNDPPADGENQDGETQDGETQDGENNSGVAAQGHLLINKLKMNSRNARIGKIHKRKNNVPAHN
jgi:hypothetical protein